MAKKFSGLDISVSIGAFLVQFEEVSLTIDDKSKAVSNKGRPNGHVTGAVSASGEIVVDTDNLLILLDAAKQAGSWQQLDTFDINMGADAGNNQFQVEAFECLIKISDLLSADPNSEDKLTHTLPYEVTGKEFVKINGVPYADPSNIENLR